ncbi:hypothetical protein GYMLUDRAFT_262404 [Collybiopsis luxurians FD-317 M1]|uniref:Protein kinase domain-containing protein n=1 Tax=Collybiopsis luxurians FD-317 M1 TaxID=944289 RepID=A0A0D0BT81_9AGAR|nr:hypothetical protein GYMLUDRAFT_262404 [Collybiopsis luxurians FD-317 M1]
MGIWTAEDSNLLSQSNSQAMNFDRREPELHHSPSQRKALLRRTRGRSSHIIPHPHPPYSDFGHLTTKSLQIPSTGSESFLEVGTSTDSEVQRRDGKSSEALPADQNGEENLPTALHSIPHSHELIAADIRRALLWDEGAMINWLNDILKGPGKSDTGHSAEQVIDVLQLASFVESVDLEECFLCERGKVYRRRCLRLLRHLSNKYQIIPASLTVRDVARDGRTPVGGGGFADIWHGTMGDQHVCLKVLRLVIEPDEKVRKKIRKQFCNEALLWRQLRHPNILPLLGVNEELFHPSFCLISPWMTNKDIISFLKWNPEHNRHRVLSEVAAGLAYLHSRSPPIIHGDIRGANVLVTDDLRCCLADFGLALVTAESRSWSTATTSTMKGATRWMAPELIISRNSTMLPNSNDASRDIYAFGCTIVEVPFHNRRNDAAVLYSLIKGERPPRPQTMWCTDAIWKLINRCWADDPAARPKAFAVHRTLIDGSQASQAREDSDCNVYSESFIELF